MVTVGTPRGHAIRLESCFFCFLREWYTSDRTVCRRPPLRNRLPQSPHETNRGNESVENLRPQDESGSRLLLGPPLSISRSRPSPPRAPPTSPTPIRRPQGRRAQRSCAAWGSGRQGEGIRSGRGSMSLVSGASRRRARIGR